MKVTLRLATANDEAVLLRWRNDPATVCGCISEAPVSSLTHKAWLANLLRDPSRRLYIACFDGAPAGTVRAEVLDGGLTELSWTVAPGMRGKGVGKDMVMTVIKFLNGTVMAKIKDGNKASEKIALSAGFVKTGSAQGFSIWTIDTAARLQSRAE